MEGFRVLLEKETIFQISFSLMFSLGHFNISNPNKMEKPEDLKAEWLRSTVSVSPKQPCPWHLTL